MARKRAKHITYTYNGKTGPATPQGSTTGSTTGLFTAALNIFKAA